MRQVKYNIGYSIEMFNRIRITLYMENKKIGDIVNYKRTLASLLDIKPIRSKSFYEKKIFINWLNDIGIDTYRQITSNDLLNFIHAEYGNTNAFKIKVFGDSKTRRCALYKFDNRKIRCIKNADDDITTIIDYLKKHHPDFVYNTTKTGSLNCDNSIEKSTYGILNYDAKLTPDIKRKIKNMLYIERLSFKRLAGNSMAIKSVFALEPTNKLKMKVIDKINEIGINKYQHHTTEEFEEFILKNYGSMAQLCIKASSIPFSVKKILSNSYTHTNPGSTDYIGKVFKYMKKHNPEFIYNEIISKETAMEVPVIKNPQKKTRFHIKGIVFDYIGQDNDLHLLTNDNDLLKLGDKTLKAICSELPNEPEPIMQGIDFLKTQSLLKKESDKIARHQETLNIYRINNDGKWQLFRLGKWEDALPRSNEWDGKFDIFIEADMELPYK